MTTTAKQKHPGVSTWNVEMWEVPQNLIDEAAGAAAVGSKLPEEAAS